MLKWSMHLSFWMRDRLLWWQHRGGPASDWHSSGLHMNMLDRRIWKSSIRLETKLRLYGCKTWASTNYLHSRLDEFDTWALCNILRIPYTHHVSNVESEEPLVVYRFLTWWLIDVCSFSAVLLAVHLVRITTDPCSGYPTSTARLEATNGKI